MSGKLTLISSATASSSSSVEFTSGIDSTYDEYVFYFVDINPATNNAFFTFQVNATDSSGYDRTMTTTYFDAYHEEDGTGGTLEYRGGYDQAQGTAFQTILPYMGNDADACGAGELHLFNPSSTTYVKHFYIKTNYYYSADASYATYVAGYINDTTAIDDVQFKMSTGNFDGNIYLFGVS